ncbi:hypothetical protein ACFL0D_05905 [Thermoproteota archaeon]
MNKKICKKTILSILFLLIVVNSGSVATILGYVEIDPFEPQTIKKGEIPNLGPYVSPIPKEYRCYLEEGHKYHIFLVGGWITNRTDLQNVTVDQQVLTRTDYDIEVRNPNSRVISINTESAGLPEQVANDEKHQFFVPAQTGDYTFRIFNDPKDSEGERAATFMIIEHLEVNTRYNKELIGKPFVGAPYPNGYKVGYEFNTSAEEFVIFIDVPSPVPDEGISGLDMYEARLFPMANPLLNYGHHIQGLGVPFGKYLERKNFQDINYTAGYGGYNTDIEGYLIPEMRVSCESAGVDMKMKIGNPDVNTTEAEYVNVFYYLALLAEYFKGEVGFYVKTDFRPVNLTLIDKLEVGYSEETTLIKVDTESAVPVRTMWMEYTADSWETINRIDLVEKPEYWLAALPRFELNENVEYRINAKDEIDNKGTYSGSFKVMNKFEIDYGTSGQVVQGGQSLRISGAASLPYVDLTLKIEHGEAIQDISLKTDSIGSFAYDYTPKDTGIYSVSLSYAGDEDYHSSQSIEKSFQVDPRELQLICLLGEPPYKSTMPMEVHGKVMPAIQGLTVEVIFVSPVSSFIETATTRRDGSYSFFIEPDTVGGWEMLPQLKTSSVFESSQGGLINFDVVKLTPIEIAKMKILAYTEPPLLYIPIGGFALLIALLEYRAGFIRGIFRKKEDIKAEVEIETEAEELDRNGTTSYKRRSTRNNSDKTV